MVEKFYLHHIAAKEILILLEGTNVLSALTTLVIVRTQSPGYLVYSRQQIFKGV